MRLRIKRPQLTDRTIDLLEKLSECHTDSWPILIEKAVCCPHAWLEMVEAVTKPAASAKPKQQDKKLAKKVANDYVDRWTFDTDSPRNPTQEEIDAMLNAYDYDAPRAGYAAFAEARATLGLPHITYEALIEQWRAYLTR